MAEAIERIDTLVRSKRAAIVVTPNVDHVIRAQKDQAYAELVRGADLVLADGQPIVWVSRLVGTPLKERVAGSDLFPRLCGFAAEKGYRVFFFGGDPGAAEGARDVLQQRYPGLRVVGTCYPPYGFETDPTENRKSIEAIWAARPDILFVGLGSPKQERWIAAHMHEYGPAVSIGVGISFSFVAGHVRRAPRWMRRAGLEWLHRLWMEPRRLWKRYLVRGWAFLPVLFQSIRASMLARTSGARFRRMTVRLPPHAGGTKRKLAPNDTRSRVAG
jgi:N-acetylglucosaminyldiphosphoundecaprenol N-acetyl-beta-D-mannosaminyltransferase